jgi:hypothetical protein
MLRCGPTVAIEATAPSSTRYGRTAGTDHTDLTSGTGGKEIDRRSVARTEAYAQRLSPDHH